MMRLSILATILLISHRAAADQASAPTKSSEAEEAEEAEEGAMDPAVLDTDVLKPRHGLHIGFGVGGGYVPVVNASAAVVRVDFNWGMSRIDVRLSPIFYYATQPGQESMGGGIALQRSFHFNSIYTISAGSIIAVHHNTFDNGDVYTTLALAVTASPLTLRLGAKRNVELGLQLMVLREFEYNTVNPGGLISLSYLAL